MTAIARDSQGQLVQALRWRLFQNITVAGTTARTTAGFGERTRVVRLCSTTACWYRLGDSTVEASATTSVYLPAGVVEPISVHPGESLAVIQASAGGTLNICEGT